MQRTLRFAQHLPKYGWRPIVLTAAPRAYQSAAVDVGNELPADLRVERAFCLDTARHLSLFGRYPRRLAVPDRWATWRSWAVRKALKLTRAEAIDVLWSTFPIATAHLIGLEVARRTGLPWVAEFRDPMWQGDYPPDPVINRSWLGLERRTLASASRIVVTTPGAIDLYRERYPQTPRKSLLLIENGFDEETFARLSPAQPHPVDPARPFTLLHSGVIYSKERDPTQLFEALARLKRAGRLTSRQFRLVLRASGNEADFKQRVVNAGIDDLVSFLPATDYLEALREMRDSDALLLLQASDCNSQIPAKLYEYLRAGRPILALTDPVGDTARAVQRAAAGHIARLDQADGIAQALMDFIPAVRAGTAPQPSPDVVSNYSRESQTRQLAGYFDEVL